MEIYKEIYNKKIENKKLSNLQLFFSKQYFDNIYSEAISLTKNFVQNLTEKSEIFLFFLQLISGCSINLLNNEFISRISILDAEIIKNQKFQQ